MATQGGGGGVSAAEAASDPVASVSAPDVVAAHYLAGKAAYGAGQQAAAAELFAHPIAEVHAELEPVFTARGVQPFDRLMANASERADGKGQGSTPPVPTADPFAPAVAAGPSSSRSPIRP